MDIVMWLMAHSIVAVLAVFALIIITTYWPGRRSRFQRDAMIPLRDDQ
jgi:cbb3-type cytochrome oxidase subunit 3